MRINTPKASLIKSGLATSLLLFCERRGTRAEHRHPDGRAGDRDPARRPERPHVGLLLRRGVGHRRLLHGRQRHRPRSPVCGSRP